MSAGTRPGRARRWPRRLAAGAALCGIGGAASFFALDAKYPLDLSAFAAPESPRVDHANGGALTERVAADEQWRRSLVIDAMGPWLPLAAVAIEDERFWSHGGVDGRSVLRAAWVNAKSGRIRQGGSTITMQAVGMAMRAPRTYPGKAVEAFRAVQLERAWTKPEILEHYLNRVPLGGNVTGVSMGARAWFGKRAADLSLGEAALLAGLPQGPERLRPDRHPVRARQRRRAVLSAMLSLGMIDSDQAQSANASPLPTELSRGIEAQSRAEHASSWALAERPSGGVTTIQPRIQGILQDVIKRHRPRLPRGADVAAVTIDIGSATVAGYVGSADFDDPLDGQVDGARARRSPGSTLKPFIYAAAMEAGRLSHADLLSDRPLSLDGWRPTNFDKGSGGDVRVGEALRRSLNLPAIRAARLAGLARVIGMIEAAGVHLAPGTAADAGLALVTGATRVSLLDLTNAYATLGRGGLFVETTLFADERRGGPPKPTRAMSEETAGAIFDMLSDSHRAPLVHGGPSQIGGLGFMWKTGTSSAHADAWAVGTDRRLAIGIWVGHFNGAGEPAFTGSEIAEPILAELFAGLRQN